MKGRDKQTRTKPKMRDKWAVKDRKCDERESIKEDVERRKKSSNSWAKKATRGKGSFTLYYFQFLWEAVIHDIFYYRKS